MTTRNYCAICGHGQIGPLYDLPAGWTSKGCYACAERLRLAYQDAMRRGWLAAVAEYKQAKGEKGAA